MENTDTMLGCNGLDKETEKSLCSVLFLCAVLSPDQAELLVMEHNMTPVHRDLKTETRSEKWLKIWFLIVNDNK